MFSSRSDSFDLVKTFLVPVEGKKSELTRFLLATEVKVGH